MKYTIHENGWTVIFGEDFDLKNITQEQVLEVSRLLATNTLVIFKKQHLTVEEEVRIIKMFKDPRQFYPEINEIDSAYINCIVPNSDNYLIRVTGEKDEKGNPGFQGMKGELLWHVNDPVRDDRHPLVWLYGVKGTAGSRTTWNNNIYSYRQLDDEAKERYSKLKIIVKHARQDDEIQGFTPNLVHTYLTGEKGLYYPFNQIKGFVGLSESENKEIMDELTAYTTQEKFLYHHDWDDGDLTIAEQWSGVHKRWPFEGMDTRVLHRAVFRFPEQDYGL